MSTAARVMEAAIAVLCLAAVFICGFAMAVWVAQSAPTADVALDRAEAKATFDKPDQVIVEFPALVRGRIVNCTVYANTKRRASAVIC